ncbi:hypothetical protein Tsubulata_026932 [Turnera subulata]|uniref:WRKY domain-containing protein n=1 Tax=Turnera subulata TaxID=218843 RepID=A0A9Q0G285_9ROSI|nr:hypothetical protein Tsubulata_026932 [Turnera subulata]
MGTCWPHQTLSTHKEKMMKELVHGQEFAAQLQVALQRPRNDGLGAALADELMVKILKSFTESISMLSSSESSAGAEVCQNLASSQVDSACCDEAGRSEDSGESRKRPANSGKDKRGCYKRKKSSQSWTIVTTTVEDGQSWRKYGQKEILNAKYPRSYYRCTRKYDQGCKATKQVQKMEENPEMYHTTYIGNHTCKDTLKSPQIITDSDPWECYYSASNNSTPKIPSQQNGGHFITTAPASTLVIKQESKEETPSDLTADNNVNSSMESLIWKDLMVSFESSSAHEHGLTRSSDNYGAPTSSLYSICTEATSQSLDMEFVAKSIDFDGDFHFDESELIF